MMSEQSGDAAAPKARLLKAMITSIIVTPAAKNAIPLLGLAESGPMSGQ